MTTNKENVGMKEVNRTAEGERGEGQPTKKNPLAFALLWFGIPLLIIVLMVMYS